MRKNTQKGSTNKYIFEKRNKKSIKNQQSAHISNERLTTIADLSEQN